MTKKRKVLVTGACGYIAQRMWSELSERYDITALDVRSSTAAGKNVDGLILCDLSQPHRDAYREHFSGIDTVVHCGYMAAPGESGSNADIVANTDQQFVAEHANLGMAYNIYRTALEEEVARVVVASSNHASDYYERLIWDNRMEHITPNVAPRSDNFYGWSKASYELLGFVFASGQVGGRPLGVVQLRIGGPRDHADLDGLLPGQVKDMHRGLGAYLSQRDQVQLFVKSIEAPDISDEHGVAFQIFYGVSGNTHNFWELPTRVRSLATHPRTIVRLTLPTRLQRSPRAVEC